MQLGGTGAEEDGRYVLGDDALAVLKDIKRWLKLYDEKLHRLDVARCLAEANLVKGDLLEILATWPESEEEDKIRAKIALACGMRSSSPCYRQKLTRSSGIASTTYMATRKGRVANHGQSPPAYAVPSIGTNWIQERGPGALVFLDFTYRDKGRTAINCTFEWRTLSAR